MNDLIPFFCWLFIGLIFFWLDNGKIMWKSTSSGNRCFRGINDLKKSKKSENWRIQESTNSNQRINKFGKSTQSTFSINWCIDKTTNSGHQLIQKIGVFEEFMISRNREIRKIDSYRGIREIKGFGKWQNRENDIINYFEKSMHS